MYIHWNSRHLIPCVSRRSVYGNEHHPTPLSCREPHPFIKMTALARYDETLSFSAKPSCVVGCQSYAQSPDDVSHEFQEFEPPQIARARISERTVIPLLLPELSTTPCFASLEAYYLARWPVNWNSIDHSTTLASSHVEMISRSIVTAFMR